MQQIVICGFVGKDPETKTINGKQLYEISVGCSSGFGEKQKTTWYKVAHWGASDSLYKYVKKGTKVIISGKLEVQEFEKKAGGTGYSLSITCQSFEFAGGAKDGNQSTIKSEQPNTTAACQAAEDDLPF